MYTKMSLTALSLALLAATPINAQVMPDAGRVLQEMPAPKTQLPGSVDLDVQIPQTDGQVAPGGPKVQVKAIQFGGNSRIESSVLQDIIAPALTQELDLKGLQDVARLVTAYYREQGYPFARAYLPAQRMQQGELNIEVIEGRYGQVYATSDDAELPRKAEPFLASLTPGEVIETAPLERAVLILSDLPGVSTRPVIRPGQEVGTGDLEVQTNLTDKWEAQVSLDNHGNRYTGRHRLTLEGALNSALIFGDQVSAAVMATDEKLYFGNLNYAMPLGGSGLRGNVGYAKSAYELGSDFKALGAEGTAEIGTLGLSYPVLRSNNANVLLSAHYQYKDLEDKYTRLDMRNRKSSHTLPLGVQFDVRDSLLGGGITYGGLTYTAGDLSIRTRDLKEQDKQTAKTAGSFSKLNLDLARLQALPANFSLFTRVLGQWANDNLDSSEGFSLGGANGVRAYPQGEGVGDQGVLAQAELRYNAGKFMPYAFWDAGKVKVNRNPWVSGDNHRSISGGGLGVRVQVNGLSIDGAAAWRHHGGGAETDTRKQHPVFWLKTSYKF